MHLAYSAINTMNNGRHPSSNEDQDQPGIELLLRYQAYEAACTKYSREIAAIQKYMPGWLPKFR